LNRAHHLRLELAAHAAGLEHGGEGWPDSAESPIGHLDSALGVGET
jgi:hypothetical protein